MRRFWSCIFLFAFIAGCAGRPSLNSGGVTYTGNEKLKAFKISQKTSKNLSGASCAELETTLLFNYQSYVNVITKAPKIGAETATLFTRGAELYKTGEAFAVGRDPYFRRLYGRFIKEFKSRCKAAKTKALFAQINKKI